MLETYLWHLQRAFQFEASRVRLDLLMNCLHVLHYIPALNIIQMLHREKKSNFLISKLYWWNTKLSKDIK